MIGNELIALPKHFELERELLEQLSGRAGHQRCVVGRDELLLILHEVPRAGVPERKALLFWRRMDGRWLQPGGPGINELHALLGRFTEAIDNNELRLENAATIQGVFAVIRQAAPLARTLRNGVHALEQVLVQEPDDREIRSFRDHAKELERAAELLQIDARETLLFMQAEAAENHVRSSEKLGKILYRLNLVTGFFLPLVALASLLGMNVILPGFLKESFWFIIFGALVVGFLLLRYVKRESEKE